MCRHISLPQSEIVWVFYLVSATVEGLVFPIDSICCICEVCILNLPAHCRYSDTLECQKYHSSHERVGH